MSERLKVILKYGKSPHLKITQYPDGQQNVTLDLEYFNNPKMLIDIYCTVRNWHEMELLLCTLAALNQADYLIHEINFAYIFGMRSDRIFELGMANYWRDVIVPILENIQKTYNTKLKFLQEHGRSLYYLKEASTSYYHKLSFSLATKFAIAGDESAIEIIRWFEECWDKPENIAHFIKKRNTDGTIKLMLLERFISIIKESELPILIMDDICDGGATFIAESMILRDIFPDKKLELFVYHGIFSKGIDVVANNFDRIYMTNSYQEINHPKVKMIEVI